MTYKYSDWIICIFSKLIPRVPTSKHPGYEVAYVVNTRQVNRRIAKYALETFERHFKRLILITIITAYWPRLFGLHCEISDRGFIQKTEVWYFTVQTEQARSIIGLLYGWTESVSICFSRVLNRLSSVSLGITIYGRHACSIKNNLVVWNFYL
jgi:hypothetical protein